MSGRRPGPLQAAITALALAAGLLVTGGPAFGQTLHNQAEPSTCQTATLTTTELQYGRAADQDLTFSRPDCDAILGVVVMVHSGGWYSGDKGNLAPEAADVARAGFAIFNIDYRLDSATVPGFPQEPNDVRRAVLWVRANADRLDVSADDFTLLGASAGANLVDLVGPALNSKYPGLVGSVVSMSAPTDLPSLIKADKATPFGLAINLWIGTYLGCDVSRCPQQVEEAASPIDAVDNSDCPRYLLINGTHEAIPLTQARTFARRLRAADCAVSVLAVPRGGHAQANWKAVEPQVISFLEASASG